MSKKEFEFEGSGFKGAKFEKKGMQERNLQTLLKTLSKKETQKSIEALAKIEPKEWSAMAAVSTNLKEFLELGGSIAMFESMTSSITETINLQIQSLLSGVTNEINTAINDILGPFLEQYIMPIINDLTTFMGENSVGAGIGGIAGGVIGLFVGNPLIGAFIGSIIGSFFEAYMSEPMDDSQSHMESGSLIGYAEWRRIYFEPGKIMSYAAYLAWVDEQTAANASTFDPSETHHGGR